MSIETARECFLDLMLRAQWSEQHEGEIDPSSNRYIDRTTHSLVVSDRDLALLADALGIVPRIYETTAMAIKREIRLQEAA